MRVTLLGIVVVVAAVILVLLVGMDLGGLYGETKES